jgi:hypothetical protein
MRRRLLALVVLTCCIGFAVSPQQAQAGQPIRGVDITYSGTHPLKAFLQWASLAGGDARIEAWEVRAGRAIRAYDIDMMQSMHMIVVSDDLTEFQHVHPRLLPNGHFVIEVHLAHPDEAYHVYLDGLPHGDGRDVFRFDVPSPGGTPVAPRSLHAAGSSADAGPYDVTIDPTSVPAGEIATIQVRIFKNGKPAGDLHPYLGVMSHGVLIGTNDLAYMHAHAITTAMLGMASGAGDCGDSMMVGMKPMPPNSTVDSQFAFQILAPVAEPYDFWIQFVGGTTLYTAPLLITAK